MGAKDVAIGVFAYNFPHKKTQDFLFHLKTHGFNVRVVIAADPVKLHIPPASIRTKIRHRALLPPLNVARALGFDYQIVPHNSPQVVELLKNYRVELGIIAGARILKPHVINAVPLGIINFHPGLIPEARGLDAVLWSILEDIPLGVTAHLIDEKIDAGTILLKKRIPIYSDDSIYDLTERVYEFQLEMLEEAVIKAVNTEGTPVSNMGKYHRKMPPELEHKALSMVPEYVKRHAGQE
jgi:phosphoribosylglycinamide formyltransferase-1